MTDDQAAIFVFESHQPVSVVVYLDLEWARESLESLDVAGDGEELAFTATGQVVRVEPSDDLFATLDVTEQVDLERLQTLLRTVRGPAHLADDPSAYAQEWTRLDELDAERPPFVPRRVWSWYQDKARATPQGPGRGGARNPSDVRLRLQWVTDDGARVRVALWSAPDGAWTQEESSGRAAIRYMEQAGIKDVREWSELEQQARAACREWGPEGGFAEWTFIRGTKRFPGDLMQAASD